jgi:transcription initiation factor TFIIE subunit alpha
VARAFYDEEIPAKGPNRSKSDKSDNRGIAVVILDALTRRQWVKEDDLAKVLRLHPKQLRRTLRVLEEEMLVIREHRREVFTFCPWHFNWKSICLSILNSQPKSLYYSAM